ncbi:odorant receptor 94b [Bactrocera neohumeralis]|uniref:odorant receptor 94b n=1 Tax=Bactrocera neohumeralis TaxID=98809 RepID=UPI002165E766|nr:odorant receptor 94b [Bactrocera neohumeralis]XP_050321348.1 odorant receptor 94b [Bactrocera neohumeralis]
MAVKKWSPRNTSSTSRTAAANIIIAVLKPLGFWQWTRDPRQPYIEKVERAYRIVLHITATSSLILLMLTGVLLSQDLEEISSILHILLTEFALVVKALHIWRKGGAAWRFMDEVANDPIYALRQQSEWTNWQRAQRSFAIVTYTYCVASAAVIVFASIGVMMTPADVYVLPFNIYVPFEWHHPRRYWYVWTYNTVAGLMTCISNTTLDMIYCYFMFHLSLLYKLIGWRLSALRRRANEPPVIKQMSEIFQMHMNVRRLTTECETLVSIPVFGQIILSAFILCFCGYRLQQMDNLENLGVLFSTVQFATVMAVQIFLPCYFGNKVTEYSNALTDDIFNSDWTTFDGPTRKFMILYMELLKRPANLKSANYFKIGLPIFVKTINNAYSIFALVLNMNN